MPCGSYILIQPVAVMHLFPDHLLDSATAMLEYFSCTRALWQRLLYSLLKSLVKQLLLWRTGREHQDTLVLKTT